MPFFHNAPGSGLLVLVAACATTSSMKLEPSDNALKQAVEILGRGGLVAFPTETVYGLGADATSDGAVAAVFAAKARPQFNPLIAHVANLQAAQQVVEFSEAALKLATRFWPGPLTLVLPRRAGCAVSLLASAGLDDLAVRVPAHPVAQALLAAFGRPVVAPSANRSGRVSPTTAQHVADDFDDEIELIMDAGACALGVESTVIGFEQGAPILLRPGALPRAEIEAVVGPLGSADASGRITSPGQLISHYAPSLPLRLGVEAVQSGEALLAFGGTPLVGAVRTLNLSVAGDDKEAAANLFAFLRTLDAQPATGIAVMTVPNVGLGEAINDRLRRAAAPRPASPE